MDGTGSVDTTGGFRERFILVDSLLPTRVAAPQWWAAECITSLAADARLAIDLVGLVVLQGTGGLATLREVVLECCTRGRGTGRGGRKNYYLTSGLDLFFS